MSNFKSLLGLNELSVDSLNIANLDLTNTNIIGLNTDRVPEDADPVNLYFTNSRFDTRIGTTSINALSDVTITGTPADDQLLIYNTGRWRNTTPPFLRLDGTASMTGNINMGGQSITNVNLVDGIDVSVLDSSVVKLTGNQSIAGTKTFTDKITTAVGKPIIIGRSAKGVNGPTGGLELYGTYADNIGGAHLQAITSEDDYPTFSLINTSHGSIFMGFDAYIDNFNWRSSYATSNFAIAKSGDYLRIFYDSNNSVGSIVQWENVAITIDTAGLTTTKAISATGLITANAGIDMNGQSITNVNLVDGIDVSVLDSSAVKLTGNQSIAGAKTFTDKITTSLGAPIIIGRATKGVNGATGGLELYGNQGDTSGGAIIQAVTSEDDYPTFYLINPQHDAIIMAFDAYYSSGEWRSSYGGSNFAIAKFNNQLQVFYDSNKLVGDIIPWQNVAISIDTDGLTTTKAISATGLITANAGIDMKSQSITNMNQLNGRTISTLYSEHDANNAKVSADGSINTHNDVTITGTPADNQLLIYSTGQWRNQNSPFLRLDGTVNMTAGLNMGGFAISNVGNVDGVDVSVLDSSVVKLTGDQTIGGTKTFSNVVNASAGIDAKSQKITNLLTPTATTDVDKM